MKNYRPRRIYVLLLLLGWTAVVAVAGTRRTRSATASSRTDLQSAIFVRQPGALPLESLLRLFNVTQQGLSVDEAAARLDRFGKNELAQSAKRISIWTRILHQFTEDRLVQILLLTAVVSAVLADDWWEPGILVAILIVNSAMTVVQEQAAEKSVASLQKLQATTSKVLRRNGQTNTDGNNNGNGDMMMIDSCDTVPGDVVKLAAGDKVPADCRIIATHRITVDESSLTGESIAVEKMAVTLDANYTTALAEQVNMVYAGTTVVSGGATALVVHTGMMTEFGKIQASLDQAVGTAPPKTPLAMQLETFGNQLSAAIGIICIVVWLTNIRRFDDPAHGGWCNGALYYFKVAVALGVAAIPEGLPAVIRLALQSGVTTMAKRNVILRNLHSVETLGCTSVICTDKTGTLTTNQMTVVSLVVLDRDPASRQPMFAEHAVTGTSYNPEGAIQYFDTTTVLARDIAAVAALCNDATIVQDEATGAFDKIGEATEAALCTLAEKMGYPVGLHRDAFPRLATCEFSRDRKSMSVLVKNGNNRNNRNRLLVKGAPNLLFQRCSHIRFRDGRTVKLQGRLRRQVEAKISELSQRPLRCLALAVKENGQLERSLKRFGEHEDINTHPLLSKPERFRDIESGLTLVGVVGIKDPARPGVAESMTSCAQAGIRVIMITGDAKDTAVAIARDVNILPPRSNNRPVKAFEGREFFDLPEQQQLEVLKRDNIVFCRAEPSDKQKLVKMLQSLSEIPAMTGDGVNDAPALKQAAIGVAMGITGTEVSKEAADMILADDNFCTIVAAVEEGRRIYANMQSFICFLISCNIGEICAIFFAALAGLPEPLSAMHLLWVNLVTDGPPATAIGFNPAAPNLMQMKPRPSNEPIMTSWLFARYCTTGLYVGLATIGVFVQHYLRQGITWQQLTTWSQCGMLWSPGVADAATTGAVAAAASCTELFQGQGRLVPQTLALTTLVCMELFKALSAVSVDSSIFHVSPLANRWLLLGVAGPLLLHLGVLYSDRLGYPGIGANFGMVPLSMDNWKTILIWAAPILLLEELLKAIGRFNNARHHRTSSTRKANVV